MDGCMDGWKQGMNECGAKVVVVIQNGLPISILVATQQSKVGMNDYYHIYLFIIVIHVFLVFWGAMFCLRIGYYQTKRLRVGANKRLIGWVL